MKFDGLLLSAFFYDSHALFVCFFGRLLLSVITFFD